jgi:hypothetical protein
MLARKLLLFLQARSPRAGEAAMTMTELIGTLERIGWRFQVQDGNVSARMPSPPPADAGAVLATLARRRLEAASFLRVRADADRLRELFGLPEIPVFHQTPPPEARLLSFPVRIEDVRPTPVRRRS